MTKKTSIGEKIIEKFLEILKPKCPYCSVDVSYTYYGNNGERYCPNCMNKLKR